MFFRMRSNLTLAVLATVAGCSSMHSSSSTSTSATRVGDRVQTIDHSVPVRSMAPSMDGQSATLYVRERATAPVMAHAGAGVVLFVHGAGTPAEVAFDAPGEYSWMAFLADAGFDTFAVDMTGYGRSTRPAAMSDPCNLAAAQQSLFVPSLIAAPCAPTFTGGATTIASDWNDVDAAVNYIRTLRHVDRVSIVAWSLGGPRAGGYAAQHPDRVDRLVLLAPAYSRTASDNPPATRSGAAFNTQTHDEFVANWDRQVGCPTQYDTTLRENLWARMLESDPVGAKWGTGVRRAPQTTSWGWNASMVAKSQTPMLLVTGEHDKQVPSATVHELYADLGNRDKVLIDLACSSHNAMWEKNHVVLFKASLEWLTHGTVNGVKNQILKLGNS